MLTKYILLLILKIFSINSACVESENHCFKCNPMTKLCAKCENDIYVPDNNGGCQNAKICILGSNQCLECEDNGQLCKTCVSGYFPDENGGCSYTDNCEVSYRGKCLKCKKDYILIGEEEIKETEEIDGTEPVKKVKDLYNEYNEIRICKSLLFGDLKNCEEVNIYKGFCEKCKKNYFLNSGDRKCTSTENCYESSFDICTKCRAGYYLDKREGVCKVKTKNFEFCKLTIDGQTCDTCDNNYYLDEENKCISINKCLKTNNFNQCENCIYGYIPSNDKYSCVQTENCQSGDKDLGLCSSCVENYYLDVMEGKCKSNKEENDFKFCKIADNNICKECIDGYILAKDNKCAITNNCIEVDNGVCVECEEKYHLGLDNQCTNVEHCIYSENNICKECEESYYYFETDNTCVQGGANFTNCKSSTSNTTCEVCKINFYLNQTDKLCYDNRDINGQFYKCSKTDSEATKCDQCEDGFFLGQKDYKCSKVPGCALSENENKCLECDLYFCLNVTSSNCIYNDDIESEEKKFIYKCKKTNAQGNTCEVCMDGFILSANGLCYDDAHCEERNEDGSCKRCQSNEEGLYCLNKYFGCVDIYINNNCLQCDDIFDFISCNKCLDGYTLDEDGNCIENE